VDKVTVALNYFCRRALPTPIVEVLAEAQKNTE
jgi:hypothetical protein